MSLVTFKNKSIVKHKIKRSGTTGNSRFLPQGPFGSENSLQSQMLKDSLNAPLGNNGFSINGSRRFISVGREMANSKNGTKFKGIYPVGYGGTIGHYAQPDVHLNAGEAKILLSGTQELYTKPSTVSTATQIRQKHKGIYTGQYPNNWVQESMGSCNLSHNTSQGLYVEKKSVSNMCVFDINDRARYEGHIKNCGGNTGDDETLCERIQIRKEQHQTMKQQQSSARYTKTINNPLDSSLLTKAKSFQCVRSLNSDRTNKSIPIVVTASGQVEQFPIRRHFPFRTNGACGTSVLQSKTPPDWFVNLR